MTCARWSLTAESLSRLWRVVWGTPAQDWSSREARVYSSDTCLPARTRTPETDTASALIKLDWGVKPHIIYQVALKLWCFVADGSIATDHYFSSSVLLDFNNKSEYVSGSAPSSLSCLFSPAAVLQSFSLLLFAERLHCAVGLQELCFRNEVFNGPQVGVQCVPQVRHRQFGQHLEKRRIEMIAPEIECSCGSVVEHCVCSAKAVGSIPREHTYWQYMYNLNAGA